MFKKRKVVMLPTNERSQIWMGTPALGLRHDHPGSAPFIKYFHLYFLSDEEIDFKKDYVYHVDAAGDRHIIAPNTWIPNPIFCSKIIATSDTSLTEKIEMLGTGSTYIFNLPQPSQSFIEKFVEEYNKGNIITEVMVEYENDKEYWAARNLFNPNAIDFKVYTLEEKEKYKGILFDYHPIKLKVNPKDNTITIRKMKDSWNREEVAVLLQKAIFYGMGLEEPRTENSAKSQQKRINKWIEENLLTLLKANK